jgi:hypothetical protein
VELEDIIIGDNDDRRRGKTGIGVFLETFNRARKRNDTDLTPLDILDFARSIGDTEFANGLEETVTRMRRASQWLLDGSDDDFSLYSHYHAFGPELGFPGARVGVRKSKTAAS